MSEGVQARLSTLLGVFFMIMMAVFAAEMTVMQLYSDSAFSSYSAVQRAFLDATTLILLIAVPLWYFVFRPAIQENSLDSVNKLPLALQLYATVLAALYLIQFLIMLTLPALMLSLPGSYENLVDGVLTVIISAPLFWWLLYRLELHCRIEPLADFINAPMTLYVLLLFMIFLADMLQEILLQELVFPHLSTGLSPIYFHLLDTVVTIVLIAPLLLILVVWPLRRLGRSEKARTSAIYDQVVDAIIRIDRKGIVESFNLAAQNMFGAQAEAVIGRPVSTILPPKHLDVAATLRDRAEALEEQPLRFHDLSVPRENDDALIFDASLSKIKLDGPDEYLLMLRDIRERKKAEADLLASNTIFREIYNQTEDAILFLNPENDQILDVNAKTLELYGFSHLELQKKGYAAFCSQDAANRLKEFFARIKEVGQAQIDHLENHRKNGDKIDVSVHAKIIQLKGNQIIYCTVRDITERVRLESEAREIQAKLIHANKMTSLGLMVSGVAHEINNPNNFILSNAQLFTRIWKDAQIVLRQYYQENGDFVLGGMPFAAVEENAPELLDGITEGARRINAIVSDLKGFARQEISQAQEHVNMNDVARSAVSILHHELVKYTDKFYLDLADEVPPVVGSSQQLGQVIINLLMNACQALRDRDCAIWLETGFDAQNGLVRISVRDQGVGLPGDGRDKILEPFFSTKLDSGGTGLGLSICQTIVRDHGGNIVFFSRPGKGTTFTVTLPAVETA